MEKIDDQQPDKCTYQSLIDNLLNEKYKSILGEQNNPYDWVDDYDKYLQFEAMRSPDASVAMSLLEKMSNYSEEFWCAGWIEGNEYALWDIAIGKDKKWKNKRFSEELRVLSNQCGGWWIFCDGERFATLEQWFKILGA